MHCVRQLDVNREGVVRRVIIESTFAYIVIEVALPPAGSLLFGGLSSLLRRRRAINYALGNAA